MGDGYAATGGKKIMLLHIRSLKAHYPRQYIYLVTRRGEELTPAVRGFCELF